MAQLNKDDALERTYVRRPVKVQAIQWQGWNTQEMADFLRCVPQVIPCPDGGADLQAPGLTRVGEGDWIVRDESGYLVAWTDYYFNHLYQGA